MREAFETWYCSNYWNFYFPGKEPLIKYDEVKDQYRHMDVDLAYQSFKAGVQFANGNS